MKRNPLQYPLVFSRSQLENHRMKWSECFPLHLDSGSSWIPVISLLHWTKRDIRAASFTSYSTVSFSRQSLEVRPLSEPWGRRIRSKGLPFWSPEEHSQLCHEFSSLEYLEAMCLRGLSISRKIKQCSWLHMINKYLLFLLWIVEMVTSVSQKISNLGNYILLLSVAPVA